MAIAARCMRQILVDHARRKSAEKRGGKQRDLTYIDELFKVQHEAQRLIDLNDKLNELAKLDERMADVVTLRVEIMQVMSYTYRRLGENKKANKLVLEAIRLMENYGEASKELAKTYDTSGLIFRDLEKPKKLLNNIKKPKMYWRMPIGCHHHFMLKRLEIWHMLNLHFRILTRGGL